MKLDLDGDNPMNACKELEDAAAVGLAIECIARTIDQLTVLCNVHSDLKPALQGRITDLESVGYMLLGIGE